LIEADVAIVGGGLVGASLAVALQNSPLRVVLIEAAPPILASAPAWDERCIALNEASRRILSAYGVWDALQADAAPILATHISERGSFGAARFTAAEAGLQTLGYNVPLRAIGAVLGRRMPQLPQLRVLQPARLASISIGRDSAQLTVSMPAAIGGDGAAETVQVSARLVAAADGARSAVRELLGLPAATRDYGQHAIVSAVRLARPLNGIAYERFTPEGPIALIPKPADAASLVWTVPAGQVEALLDLGEEEYRERAFACFGGRAGRFVALGRRWAYPLARVMSERIVAQRLAFIGNAAQSLHPVAAQGFNLGLRDVATLAEQVAPAADPGDADTLAEYASRRSADRGRVSGLTDFMVRAFSNRLPGLAQARHWALLAVDLSPPLRESVLRQHLGYLGLPGSLPAAAAEPLPAGDGDAE
jgi:2-octaprenyl-6-methoxyphenol hydroxylase